MVKAFRSTRPALFLAFAMTAACGDSNSPVAPSSSNTIAGPSGSTVNINGTIQSVSASDTLTVSGQSIRTEGSTNIRQAGLPLMFADLRAGLTVDIVARRQGDLLTASSIDVRDAGHMVGTPARLRGIVQEISGSPSDFLLRINGETVRGNGDSTIRDGSQTRPMADLRPGDDVDVDGRQRSGYVYAAAIDRMAAASGTTPAPSPTPTPNPPPPGPGPGPGPEPGPSPSDVTFSGTVGPIVGVCPVLVFTVDGRPTTSTSSTSFDGGACADLRTGDRVEVSGKKQGDNEPVIAHSIRRQ
jgi:hypothetical protein